MTEEMVAAPSPRAVLVLGGAENALSVVRGLSAHGIPVHVCALDGSPVLRSRFCAGRFPAPPRTRLDAHLKDLLLGTHAPPLPGAVVFACSDPAVRFVAKHRAELEPHYRLDLGDSELHEMLLDKQRTLALARRVGCAIPDYREVMDAEGLEAVQDELELPLLLKPRHTYELVRVMRRKLIMVETPDQLRARGRELLEHGIRFMATEFIPGPDTLLSSYYTYVTEAGESLFHYTKRVVRRSPPNFGGGSYHATESLPETAAAGRRFFEAIGLRGFGNVEFKEDPRDGELKLIEVNTRFTAAQELIRRSGIDMPHLVYLHLTGGRVPATNGFREGLYYWYPWADFDALRDLRQAGELSFSGWLRSLRGRPKVLPYFRLDDPLPALVRFGREVRQRVAGRLTRRR